MSSSKFTKSKLLSITPFLALLSLGNLAIITVIHNVTHTANATVTPTLSSKSNLMPNQSSKLYMNINNNGYNSYRDFNNNMYNSYKDFNNYNWRQKDK